jgi:cytochrome c biogenesis factor
MKNIFKIIVLITFLIPHFLIAQAVKKNTLVLGVKYYNDNNIPVYSIKVIEDLIKLLEKKAYHEETVSMVESIMNELKQRTWQLRDFISWEKFIGGQ